MRTPDQVIAELADNAKPDDLARLDRPFADKLARLEEDGRLGAEPLEKLRVMWQMLRSPDADVPWKAKALIMAAVSYLVSPVDAIPDPLGKLGYLDDAQVIRLVWDRIEPAAADFQRR
jgi:uncharacterized membrane protein YkvA (DUF1232 family)